MMKTMISFSGRRPALLLAFTVTMIGCREGVQPFSVEQRPDVADGTYQLTFSTERDFNPSWSLGSDSVYYATEGFIDYPTLGSTMIRIARSGGAGALLAPGAQAGTQQQLVLPVMSPAGNRIAFVHVPFVPQEYACPIGPPECAGSQARLGNGFIRIRSLTATSPAGFDPGLPVEFAGFDAGTDIGGTFTYNQEAFPFQLAYTQRGEFQVRASWAPDGQRLVFSDGLHLRVWDVSQPTATELPNTSDGVSPAWSPTGDAIAFTRHIRTDSVQITCRCINGPPPPDPNDIPIHNRWLYTVSRSVITLVGPDGSNPVEIVDGEDPAWSPDGSMIYYVANNQIYRIPRAGGTPVSVPSTTDGRWPAVSPDGQWLAFTRTGPNFVDSDIWITRLGAL